MSKDDATPQRAVRVARKDYPCTGLDRPCPRRILRGDPYTQLSYPPFQPPYAKSHVWTVLRLCSTCSPIAPGESPVPPPCPYGDGHNQCVLSEGHDTGTHPTPHQFAPEALF